MKAIAFAALFVFAGAAAQAETAVPEATSKAAPSEAATATPPASQPAATTPAAPTAPKKKVATVRHARYDGGDGSVVRTGRNAYSFGGSYGGCRYRGYANATGYHLDRAC